MKITCLIVDDEQSAREGLRALCEDYKEIEVIGICKNGIEAINEIQALKPDLVLLDIQMPKINGFEVLASIPEPRPEVIFITAHDEFAVKAFEVHAIDYLLKPFSDERFLQAVIRAITHIRTSHHSDINDLIQIHRNSPERSPDLRDSDEQRLVIKADGAIHMIQKKDICHVEAFDYYVKIHVSNRFYLIRETMKSLEDRLESGRFMRIHKSYIVNRSYIRSLKRLSNGEHVILLTTNQTLRVSRSKLNEVKKWLD